MAWRKYKTINKLAHRVSSSRSLSRRSSSAASAARLGGIAAAHHRRHRGASAGGNVAHRHRHLLGGACCGGIALGASISIAGGLGGASLSVIIGISLGAAALGAASRASGSASKSSGSSLAASAAYRRPLSAAAAAHHRRQLSCRRRRNGGLISHHIAAASSRRAASAHRRLFGMHRVSSRIMQPQWLGIAGAHRVSINIAYRIGAQASASASQWLSQHLGVRRSASYRGVSRHRRGWRRIISGSGWRHQHQRRNQRHHRSGGASPQHHLCSCSILSAAA